MKLEMAKAECYYFSYEKAVQFTAFCFTYAVAYTESAAHSSDGAGDCVLLRWAE